MARRWLIEFTDYSSSPSSRDVRDPPGFSRASLHQDDSSLSRQKKDAENNWKAQKGWEVAQAPFKNLMMMSFMMWMAGSTVHLFSVGITFSALWQPISALQGVGNAGLWQLSPLFGGHERVFLSVCSESEGLTSRWLLVFEPYKDRKVQLLGPKLLFIALNLGGLALGVWKEVEYSGGGLNLHR